VVALGTSQFGVLSTRRWPRCRPTALPRWKRPTSALRTAVIAALTTGQAKALTTDQVVALTTARLPLTSQPVAA
jgi:hypothetical protein